MSGWAGFSDAELRKLKEQKDNKSTKGFKIHYANFTLCFSYMVLQLLSNYLETRERRCHQFFLTQIITWQSLWIINFGEIYLLPNANDPNYSLNSTVSSGQDLNEASPGKRVPNILSASKSRTQREEANPISSPGALIIIIICSRYYMCICKYIQLHK